MRNINGYGMWGGGWGELADPYQQQAGPQRPLGQHMPMQQPVPDMGGQGYDGSGINPHGMYTGGQQTGGFQPQWGGMKIPPQAMPTMPYMPQNPQTGLGSGQMMNGFAGMGQRFAQ